MLIISGRFGNALRSAGLIEDAHLDEAECRRILRCAQVTGSDMAALYSSLRTPRDPIRRALAEHGIHLGCEVSPETGLLWLARNEFKVGDLHLLALTGSDRHERRKAGIVVRRWSRPLPADSFARVRPELVGGAEFYVTNPTLAFVLGSRGATFAQTVAWGTELCGAYVQADDGAWPCAFGHRASTTKKALSRGLDELRDMAIAAGAKTGKTAKPGGICRDALPFVRDGSASPMETAIATLLSLPTSRGGFGFDDFALNATVALGPREQRLFDLSGLRVDMLFGDPEDPERCIAVEYDSNGFHGEDSLPAKRGLDPERHDRARMAVAQLRGMDMIPLTWEVVRDPVRFDEFCRALGMRLGRRSRWIRGETISRRLSVRAELGLPVGKYWYAA